MTKTYAQNIGRGPYAMTCGMIGTAALPRHFTRAEHQQRTTPHAQETRAREPAASLSYREAFLLQECVRGFFTSGMRLGIFTLGMCPGIFTSGMRPGIFTSGMCSSNGDATPLFIGVQGAWPGGGASTQVPRHPEVGPERAKARQAKSGQAGVSPAEPAGVRHLREPAGLWGFPEFAVG
ncbi:hypothetical protein Taro_004683 [Colocasia esculenta]|uniref:Uncharacterized protein n=1 Tax=Colocasia esculenta TaxID=4460 RepID=A0A843TSC7_COLES|nr:hypothetical protein [Colocasia esculenta]